MEDDKRLIVAVMRREYEVAANTYREACAKHAGVIASSKVWNEHNPDDGVGGRSTNPYDISFFARAETTAKHNFNRIKSAYNLAVDTFLSDKQ